MSERKDPQAEGFRFRQYNRIQLIECHTGSIQVGWILVKETYRIQVRTLDARWRKLSGSLWEKTPQNGSFDVAWISFCSLDGRLLGSPRRKRFQKSPAATAPTQPSRNCGRAPGHFQLAFLDKEDANSKSMHTLTKPKHSVNMLSRSEQNSRLKSRASVIHLFACFWWSQHKIFSNKKTF